MNAALVSVNEKPEWQQTEPLDDSLETEELNAKRDLIAQSFDLHRVQVLWGSDPHDLAPPPKGCTEAQKQKVRDTSFSHLPPESVEQVIAMINFVYRPVRVFVVPRPDIAEIVRFFKVGTHYQDNDIVMEAVAERLTKIDRITPISVVHAGSSHLLLKFLEKPSLPVCREIQRLFPFAEESDTRLGLEGYFTDWTSATNPWFLADWFYREQRIHLWWD